MAATKPEKMQFDIVHEDPVNPRDISDKALEGLGVSMETFGDLSGIVFNLTTGQLVAGHQRCKKLRAEGVTEWFRDGDQAWALHPKTGERFPIRLVEWDEKKHRLANLSANNPQIQGEFTEVALEQLRDIDAAELQTLHMDELVVDLQAEFDPQEEEPGEGDGEGGEDDSDRVPDDFAIVVKCKDEAHQKELINRFLDEGLECRALL